MGAQGLEHPWEKTQWVLGPQQPISCLAAAQQRLREGGEQRTAGGWVAPGEGAGGGTMTMES